MRPLTNLLKPAFSMDRNTIRTFHLHVDSLIFERIKWVSILLVASYPLLFAVDFFLLRDLGSIVYRMNLFIIHSTCFFASAIFLYLRKRLNRLNKRFINYAYIAFYLVAGAAASINSQMLTGTIAAYVIVMITAAAAFPLRPLHFSFMLAGVHTFFLAGLPAVTENYYTMLAKQMNSSGAAAISLLICYSFYSFQRQNYINEERLKSKEESFKRLFSMNPSPLLLANLEENKIILMNRQATEFYETGDVPLLRLETDFIFSSANEKESILEKLQSYDSIQNYMIEYKDSAGTAKWAMLNFERVEYMEESCVLIGVSDITSFKKKEEELNRHATIDMLTGIMNRRCGLEILEGHALSPSGQEFTLCFVDINDLKSVNDKYGHNVGDEMIKMICTVISSQISSDDIFFRLGGDEFVIIFSEKTPDEAQKTWDMITVEFEILNATMQKDFKLSASYGLYHFTPGSRMTAEEIIELADKEMYKEKSNFRAVTVDL
ncbi:GGDEF domain-containing protein [Bacillus sp. FJAT-27445]|uniref:sensor domain-containing diguanylate cyclase n=1 Tax=Bacillus sp. FJAT-27445 TaxID=1679166 RepID=UPI0007434AB5|nr:GGDEF domain-containing protein [Bacillus sp. FJAT-27445]